MTIATIAFYTKSGGPLSKRIFMGADGNPQSDGSECRMARGTAINTHIASAAQMAALLDSMTSEQALSLGRIIIGAGAHPPYQRVDVVSMRNLNRAQPDMIARTKEYVGFRQGASGWLLIDHDRKGMPDPVRGRVDAAGGVWGVLISVAPVLAGAARVRRASTSSGLYNAVSGEQFPSSGGEHIYAAVADTSDIPRAMTALSQRMWLNGLGWIMLGASGQMLERSVIDSTVGSPERLVFEGAPVVEFPLAQNQERRRAEYAEGAVIDTRLAFPELTPEEQVEYRRLVADAKAALKGESEARAKKSDEELAARAAGRTGKSYEDVLRNIKKRRDGVLTPEIELEFDDPEIGAKTVANIMADPEKYVGQTLADPLEGVEYGRGNALLMGSWERGFIIHSLAHGVSARYRLNMDAAMIAAIVDKAKRGEHFKTFFRCADRADLGVEEYAVLRKLVINLSGLGARVFDAAQKEHAREKAEAERMENAVLDPRPSMRAPSKIAELNSYIEQLDGILAAVAEPVGAPIRNLQGRPARVVTSSLPGLHQLVSERAQAGMTEHIAAPPQHMIVETDAAQLALDVQPHVRLFIEVEDKETGAVYEQDVRLSEDFAKPYIGWHLSRVARVSGVATLPLVLPGREIIATNGLHRNMGIVCDIDQRVLDCIPTRPTALEDAQAAYKWLSQEWLADVATNAWGLAALISQGLGIIERHLRDQRPLHMISAGQRESGKTTAQHMIAMAVLGRPAAAAAWSPLEEERRKNIFALLLGGADFVVFDNVPRGALINSAALDAALTSGSTSDRVLGVSRNETAISSTIFAMTGNNIRAAGDTASRTIMTEIDVPSARPAGRDFRHPDPVGWTMAHRATILRALYTILMLEREAPGRSDSRFKNWWGLVGHPLFMASAVDLSQASAKAEEDDEETIAFVSLLQELVTRFGMERATKGFTSTDVAGLLTGCESPQYPGHAAAMELKTNLEMASGGRPWPPGAPNAVKVGIRLGALVNRRALYGGYTIALTLAAGGHANTRSFKITITRNPS